MADEYKVQLSAKRGEDILVLRASNANEFHALADELSRLPELQRFFPAQPAPSPGQVIQVPEGKSVEEAVAEAQAAPVSAIEKARARMRGGR